MDSVRFGRALGIGARLAAKTLVSAADAATAPSPSAPQTRSSSPTGPASRTRSAIQTQTSAVQTRTSPRSIPPDALSAKPLPGVPRPTGQNAAKGSGQIRNATRGLAQGSRRFGEAAWGPVVKLSGVLWLEFTGVFFGIFALFAAGGAWKLRDNFHRTATSADGRTHFQLALGMAIIFGYFCLSSFFRAHRRSRRS